MFVHGEGNLPRREYTTNTYFQIRVFLLRFCGAISFISFLKLGGIFLIAIELSSNVDSPYDLCVYVRWRTTMATSTVALHSHLFFFYCVVILNVIKMTPLNLELRCQSGVKKF